MAFKKRNYRLPCSSYRKGKRGPKGPSQLLIEIIVAPGDYGLWLDSGEPGGERIKILLRLYLAAAMVANPVGRLINYPANNDPQCISPVN